MNTDNIQSEINSRLKAVLQSIKFPVKQASELWRTAATAALHLTSPVTMGLSAVEFAELIGFSELNTYQFAILNNNLESKSAKDLDMSSLKLYSKLQIEVEELAKIWNSITQETRSKVIEEAIEEAKNIKQAPVIGMKPVKE